jgi:23S rRNA (cytosine1962-C5)-methyltransferase
MASFEQIHANRPAAKRQEGRASSGKANPKVSNPKFKKAAPGGQGKESSSSALGARITRRASDRLRAGSLWVYASDIESVELAGSSEEAPPALLPVADNRGLLLGTALYSPTSQIALRMLSRESLDEAGWLELLDRRLRTAIGRRKGLLDERTDACRMCFSEADELSGLVVDKYGELVILQLLARGLDSAAVRETCHPGASRPPGARTGRAGSAESGAALRVRGRRAGDSRCRRFGQNPIPAQWPALSLRCQLRAEDGRVP